MNAVTPSAENVIAAKGCFINNEWQPVSTGRTVPVVAPAEGVVFAEIAASGPEDVARAIAAARAAFEGGAWSQLSATDRGRLLSKLGQLILENIDELAALEARDCGKPMKTARRYSGVRAVFRILRRCGG